MSSRRIQGWDPILLISQIISLQSLHYLTLSLLLPPLLLSLTQPSFLEHQGGPTTVSTIMDWRELAGRPTFSPPPAQGHGHHTSWMEMFGGAWSGGRKVTADPDEDGAGSGGGEIEGEGEEWIGGWDGKVDPRRGWVIAGGWAGACVVDVLYLYHLIRRPTHILDHTLTLFGIHILLTTYYAAAFPTSLFFWAVIGIGSLGVVVWAEQVCVQREMREGFGDWGGSEERVREEGGGGGDEQEEERLMGASGSVEGADAMELGALGGAAGRRETPGMI